MNAARICSTHSDGTRIDEVCVVDLAIAIDSRLVVRAEAHRAIRDPAGSRCHKILKRCGGIGACAGRVSWIGASPNPATWIGGSANPASGI